MNFTPIFILGIHKSGTTLLRSLFDNNKNFSVVPIEMHYFKHFNFPYEYSLTIKKKNQNTINQSVSKLIEEYNQKSNSYSDNSQYYNDRKDELNSICFSESALDSNNFVKLCNFLIEQDSEVQSTKYVIEKSVDNLEYAEILSQMFPNAKFIHIIRNPYANFFALKQYLSINTNQTPPLGELISPLKYNAKYFFRLKKTLNNYKVITYEQLITDTEETMRDLCKFLSIEFNDNMLIPTQNGNIWEGNSMMKTKFTGISNLNKNAWKFYISKKESDCISENLKELISEFKFDKPYTKTKDLKLKTNFQVRFHNYFFQYFDHLI